MSIARDVLILIGAGLQRGVIKSPELEMMYSDGPKRVSLVELVVNALQGLPGAETGPAAEQIPEPPRTALTPPAAHPALAAANEWGELVAAWERLPFGTRAYYDALAKCDAAWERMAVACGVRALPDIEQIMGDPEVSRCVHGLIGRASSDAARELVAAVLQAAHGVGTVPATGGGWEPDAWAAYIAGMLVSYLSSENAAREVDQREAAIAGIIRRRIHWLIPARGVAGTVAASEQVSPALARQRRLVATLPQTREEVERLKPCSLGACPQPEVCGKRGSCADRAGVEVPRG